MWTTKSLCLTYCVWLTLILLLKRPLFRAFKLKIAYQWQSEKMSDNIEQAFSISQILEDVLDWRARNLQCVQRFGKSLRLDALKLICLALNLVDEDIRRSGFESLAHCVSITLLNVGMISGQVHSLSSGFIKQLVSTQTRVSCWAQRGMMICHINLMIHWCSNAPATISTLRDRKKLS